MNQYLQYILDSFVYNIIDAIAFGLGLGILIKIISLMTPLKGWEKIKENSLALVIIWTIILILFGVYAISGYFVTEFSLTK
jgi:heme/copper-type cytochrome/quinol oxidase subunit 2